MRLGQDVAPTETSLAQASRLQMKSAAQLQAFDHAQRGIAPEIIATSVA